MGNLCCTKSATDTPEKRTHHSHSMGLYSASNTYLFRNFNTFEDTYSLQPQKLGFGSFGDVKLCIDKSLSTVRAVKIINKDYLRSANIETSWFYSKIDILNRLDHPFIIRFHEFFEDRDFFYLLMDYQQQGDLLKHLKAKTIFHEPVVRRMIKQVFIAIAYMHNMKIAHRDIKPENIVISSSDFSIKLIDFDTAAKFESNDLTGSIGTSHYMAPEVKNKRYNEKCDLWSCGIILYTLLTRKMHLPGLTDNQAPKSIRKVHLDFTQPYWKKVSSAGRDLVKQLLQVDPKKRISAIEALNHPWFNEGNDEDYIGTQEILQKILRFSGRPLAKAAKRIVVHLKSHSVDLTQVEKSFVYLDSDCDGELTKNDFFKFFLKKNSQIEAEKLATIIMEKLSSSACPVIKYTDFLEVAIDEMILTTPQSLRFFYDLLCAGNEKLYINSLSSENSKNFRLQEEDLQVWVDYLKISNLENVDFSEFTKLISEGITN